MVPSAQQDQDKNDGEFFDLIIGFDDTTEARGTTATAWREVLESVLRGRFADPSDYRLQNVRELEQDLLFRTVIFQGERLDSLERKMDDGFAQVLAALRDFTPVMNTSAADLDVLPQHPQAAAVGEDVRTAAVLHVTPTVVIEVYPATTPRAGSGRPLSENSDGSFGPFPRPADERPCQELEVSRTGGGFDA